MASSNETELPEQQSSDSNTTTASITVAVESPSTETVENQAQEEYELAVLTPVPDIPDTENRHSEQVQGNSNPVIPDTAVRDIPAGAVEPQQQDLTEEVTIAPVAATTRNNVMGLTAGSDGDEAVTIAPPGSDLNDGNNNGLTTSAPPGYEHGDTEDSSSTTPELTSGSSAEENSDPVTPNSTGLNHEDEERSRSAAATPANSDHGNEENNGSATAPPADSDNGDGESSGSTSPASAGSDIADEEVRSSASPDIAPGEDPSVPSQEREDTQREAGEDALPDSGAPTGATLDDTTDEGEVQDPGATPAQVLEENASQIDAETDHGQKPVELHPPESPDPLLEPTTPPTTPLGEVSNDYEEGRVAEASQNNRIEQGAFQDLAVTADLDRDEDILLRGRVRQIPEEQGVESQEDVSQGEEGHIEDEQRDDESSEPSHEERIPEDRAPVASDAEDPASKKGNKDVGPVHLRIQYLVEGSKRTKACICISVPSTITYPALKQTILTALVNHEGCKNPHPIAEKAEISRLIAILAKKAIDGPGFLRVRELTAGNLQQTLGRMRIGSVYDVVKVQFVPGTNGEVRARKATGRIYGRSRKIGGL
ncbi:hypothetical protein IMSHALPRED_005155 [Imshaugia aleurites]|uniref:Uncharacterized protein n=1 Tax=Imshaugia aleurites TaxID=172621 RepID=A0A8H3IHS1_9LECA|nr:hypothetical protein IMSHALPRED_005155 [Imshaugia aleurites]